MTVQSSEIQTKVDAASAALDAWVREVVDTAAAIRALLDAAKDKETLCAAIRPNYDNWLWRYRPNSLAAAKELFRR